MNDMSHYIQPTASMNPDLFLIHIGTNNLRDSELAEKTANEILELAALVKTIQNEVVISSIITRRDDLNEIAQEVNTILYSQCQDYNITYLDNSNIEKYNLTYRGRFPGLHLNKRWHSLEKDIFQFSFFHHFRVYEIKFPNFTP